MSPIVVPGTIAKDAANSKMPADSSSGIPPNAAALLREWFFHDDDSVVRCSDVMLQRMREGLEDRTSTSQLKMLPTFIERFPTGNEKTDCLAVDLGGTNLRVMYIRLDLASAVPGAASNATGAGDESRKKCYEVLGVRKCKIPHFAMKGTHKDLFGLIADEIKAFLAELRAKDPNIAGRQLPLGFTFSFPLRQEALGRGILTNWAKGFETTGCLGSDVCALLEDELHERKLPVTVKALINDTAGALMSQTLVDCGTTSVGVIIGTGTNCAYLERRDAISKLGISTSTSSCSQSSTRSSTREKPSSESSMTVQANSCGLLEFDKSKKGDSAGAPASSSGAAFSVTREATPVETTQTEAAIPADIQPPTSCFDKFLVRVLSSICGTATTSRTAAGERSIVSSSGEDAVPLMCINCECGNFTCEDLRRTAMDEDLDRSSSNPGVQHIEKMIAGHYLGEIVQRTCARLEKQGVAFAAGRSGARGQIRGTAVAGEQRAATSWAQIDDFDTATMARVVDKPSSLAVLQEKLLVAARSSKDQRIDEEQRADDAAVLLAVCNAVAERSARMAAVMILSMVRKVVEREGQEKITVPIDGTVYKSYPRYRERLRAALHGGLRKAGITAEVELVDACDDGSCIGAAAVLAACC